MTTLGVDVGGTSVKCAMLDGDRCIGHGQSEPYTKPNPATLEKAIAGAFAALPAPARDGIMVRIGLCVPGVRDEATGVVIRAVNLPGLTAIHPESLVRGVLRLPPQTRVVVVSDAHAAAHSVWTDRAIPGRLFALSLGTGVGACVLDDGRPLRVSGASSGHFGQIDVSLHDPGGPVPLGPDGGRGTLEAYIGLPALRARFGDGLTAWLAAPDPASAPVRALVRGLRIAHAVYRPDTIALLGGVGLCLAPVLSTIFEHVSHEATSLTRHEWKLITGAHAHHAAEGAARLAALDL